MKHKFNVILCTAAMASVGSVATADAETVVQDTVPTLVQATGSQSETTDWVEILVSPNRDALVNFLNTYPDGRYKAQAEDLLLKLLLDEGTSEQPEVADEAPQDDAPQDDAPQDAEPAQEETQAETIEPAEPAAPTQPADVSFQSPLSDMPDDLAGKSIMQLIQGNPLHPPVEGLPESYWKTEVCSNCHTWTRADLCTQAKTYLTEAGRVNVTKKHPYGGQFKQNLQAWAQGDCK